MQLIQIGEVRQKTVLDLVMEMAARQFAEIEQLKTAAQSRATRPRSRRPAIRCISTKGRS
jgi:energy-coupling factor transporter transmembrane protein EcfT